MGARNVLATNLAKKISWGPRRDVKKKGRRRRKNRKVEEKKEGEREDKTKTGGGKPVSVLQSSLSY